MKKVFFAVACAMLSVASFAQKNEKAVGVNLSYAENMGQFGVGVTGQYGLTDRVRVEAGFDYYLKASDWTTWSVNATAHYLFPMKNDKFALYPLAGLSYTHWSTDGIISWSFSKLAVNVGGGAQMNINSNWRANAELKYQIINGYNQPVVSVGVVKIF